MLLRCMTCQCKARCRVRNGKAEEVHGVQCTGCCRSANVKEIKYFMRTRHVVYLILALVLASGIVGPFIWQCVARNVDTEKALSIWNGYVSIALGFVATTLSVVSLAMNFKTYDDATKMQDRAVETLESIKSIQRDVNEIRTGTVSLQGSKGSSIQSTTAVIDTKPTKEPEAE